MAGKISKNSNQKKCWHHHCHQEPAAAPRGARGKGPGGAGPTAPSPARAAQELLCVVATGSDPRLSSSIPVLDLFLMELKQKDAPACSCCSETAFQSNSEESAEWHRGWAVAGSVGQGAAFCPPRQEGQPAPSLPAPTAAGGQKHR